VAATGLWLQGSQLWVLAVPTLLALGWLALANPQACLRSADGPGAG
jgi:hypothetical protein